MWERIVRLFSTPVLRAYIAVTVGRAFDRAPFGSRRSVVIATAGESYLLASNTSSDQALRVSIQKLTGSGVVNFSPVSTPPSNGFFVLTNAPTPEDMAEFVLLPSEDLYAASANPLNLSLGVSQEWY